MHSSDNIIGWNIIWNWAEFFKFYKDKGATSIYGKDVSDHINLFCFSRAL